MTEFGLAVVSWHCVTLALLCKRIGLALLGALEGLLGALEGLEYIATEVPALRYNTAFFCRGRIWLAKVSGVT